MTHALNCGGVVTYQLLCGREVANPAKATKPFDQQLFGMAGSMANYCYLVVNTHDRTAVAVDAAWDIDGVYRFAEALGVTIRGAIYTHYHFDHCGGELPKMMTGGQKVSLPGAREVFDRGGDVWAGELDLPQMRKQCHLPSADKRVHSLGDGDFVVVGDLALTALNTPGHTPGSICLFAAPQTLSPREPLPEPSRVVPTDAREGLLITGDTLFVGSCGRTDLPGSDQRAMLASLSRLAALPPGVVVLPGHNYAAEPHTTVAKERAGNAAVTAGLRVCPSPAELPPCCACAAEGRGPGGWGPGRRVQLHGIAGDIGRKLNGRLAVVLRFLTGTKRYEVRLLEEGASAGPRAAGLEAQHLRAPRPAGAM